MAFMRRSLFAQTATLIAGGTLALAAPSRKAAAREQAGFIDGLGFPGGVSLDEEAPLLPEEVADIQRSGLVATHLTVGAVGGMPPLAAFEKIVRQAARLEADIDRHPRALARIRTGSDIATCAATGCTGLVCGLQDGGNFERLFRDRWC
jgi:hypothetical protein